MKFAMTLSSALLALATACCAAPSAPQSVSASYDVFRNGLHIATMDESFEVKDGGYRLASVTRAVGLFALFEKRPLRSDSAGRVTAAGLQPQHFEARRGAADPRQVRADFDWQSQRLTISRDGKTDTVALPPGTQDRISLMYQFMFLAPEKLQRLEFSMTNGRKLGSYRYTVNSGAEIDTALGRIATLHLVKQHLPDESGAEIWLSPRHRYLPVKVLVIDEDGSRYEQEVTKLDVKEPAP